MLHANTPSTQPNGEDAGHVARGAFEPFSVQRGAFDSKYDFCGQTTVPSPTTSCGAASEPTDMLLFALMAPIRVIFTKAACVLLRLRKLIEIKSGSATKTAE